MRDTDGAERLLSLFTSPDCAAAIAGDLTEQSGQRGRVWFWLDVVQTLGAQWRNSVSAAPLRVVLLAVWGGIALIGPVLLGTAAVSLFPGSFGSPMNWISLSFFWWGGALWTGASMVNKAPSRGMAAGTVLAAAGLALMIALFTRGLSLGLLTVQFAPFYATGILSPAPLLIGAAIARRRFIIRGTPNLEQSR